MVRARRRGCFSHQAQVLKQAVFMNKNKLIMLSVCWQSTFFSCHFCSYLLTHEQTFTAPENNLGLPLKQRTTHGDTMIMRKLMEQVRQALRRKPHTLSREEEYLGWIRRFLFFHGRCHPAILSEAEIGRFLEHLAAERPENGLAQLQARQALLFFYREIIGRELKLAS